MLKRLWRFLGLTDHLRPVDTEYDPVYGLPLQAIDEWLARNPRLRKQSEVRLRVVIPADVLAPAMPPLTQEKAGVP
jgi:hypothetical protein